MSEPIPVADEAVALAALARITRHLLKEGEDLLIAHILVSQASRVQFRPSTRQLVLTFDLAMGEPSD